MWEVRQNICLLIMCTTTDANWHQSKSVTQDSDPNLEVWLVYGCGFAAALTVLRVCVCTLSNRLHMVCADIGVIACSLFCLLCL